MQVGHRSDSSLLSPVAGSEMSCRQSGAGLAVPGVFGLGAVLVRFPGLVPSAGCQAAAGQPGGLQPELLAGRGQVRRGGLVQGRVAVGQAEVGGQVGALVVPAAGQVGYLVQARDRGVGAGDAAQQLPVELPAGAAVADLPVHRRPAMPAAEVPGLAQHGLQGCGLRGRGAHRPGSFPVSPVPAPGAVTRRTRSPSFRSMDRVLPLSQRTSSWPGRGRSG